jgi:hypothetical protein
MDSTIVVSDPLQIARLHGVSMNAMFVFNQ